MGLQGRVIGGRYRIGALLGGGGMGEVYAAEHVALGRQVAIKVLRPARLGPAGLARFKQEALATAKLGHPNIVQVTDFQSRPGEPALLVMELLEGESLQALLAREKRLLPSRAVFIVTQVLAALSAAHAAGIVHRDIKPANIFLSSTPAMSDLVKVLDFGIAKGPGLEGGPLTEPGRILGTVAYMAPEQATTQATDHRIDLYAVGVCLFEMLAGHRPHQARTHAELLSVFASGPLPALRSIVPTIDPNLAATVDRALQVDPGARPQTALEMLEPISAARTPTTAAKQHEEVTAGFSLPAVPLAVVPRRRAKPSSPVAQAPRGPNSAASREMLAKSATGSLIWAMAGMVLCCFPIGLVAVERGLAARALASRSGVPTPPIAFFGIGLGLVGAFVSLCSALVVLLGKK